MKRKFTRLVLFVLFIMGLGKLQAQQIPISFGQMFRPSLWNPASAGAREFNKVHLSHQQRHLSITGWRSISQFLSFNSCPVGGKHGNFGWGVFVSNDIEHTENRLAISGATAVHLIRSKFNRLSLGISAGFINWNSSYQEIRVFDRGDDLLVAPTNFVELDAGMGFDYEFINKFWDVRASAAVLQIPGNFASRQLRSLRLYPHLLAGGSVLIEPVHNVHIGPMVFYKNTVLQKDTVIQNSEFDIGLKAALDRQGIWMGGAYRLDRGALTLAMGMQIYLSDSLHHPKKSAFMVDLNAGFSYPMQESSVFGPAIEFGVDVLFGRLLMHRNHKDTVIYVNGAYWENDGNFNHRIESHLQAVSPVGLRGETYVTPKNATLTYIFPDPNLQYLGTTPIFDGDTLVEVGMEWQGIDGFLDGVVFGDIPEALHPDTANVQNAESMQRLSGMVFFELSAFLKANEAEASVNAEGQVYEGEFGTNNKFEDTLFLDVVYNGADTIIGVAKNHYVSNLELACLKLYAMNKKLKYNLEMQYGQEIAFIIEGEKVNTEDLVGKKLVTIRKPRILPNHPHQEAFQVNQLKIRYSRNEGTTVIDEGTNPEDEDEVLILDDDKKRKRRENGRFRDRH